MGTSSPRDAERAGPSTTNGLPVTQADQTAVDRFAGDTLVVFCWSDVRPLRGATGFVDWRLCGALSHAIEARDFSGEVDEVMLMPLCGRMGQRRLFIFGLGAVASSTGALLCAACGHAFDVLEKAGVERVTFVAPRGFDGDGTEEEFLQALGSERPGRGVLVESVLVGPAKD